MGRFVAMVLPRRTLARYSSKLASFAARGPAAVIGSRTEPPQTTLLRSHLRSHRRDALARLVLPPRDSELLLEVRLILLPERVVVRRRELAERALSDVVHVRVLGARDAVALRAHADGEVVVLEHPDAVRLVERADRVEDLSARGDAVHRGDADVEDPPAVLRLAARRVVRDLREVVPVIGLHARLVAAEVRRRAQEADLRVAPQVVDEPAQQAGRNDGVVVEEHDDL